MYRWEVCWKFYQPTSGVNSACGDNLPSALKYQHTEVTKDNYIVTSGEEKHYLIYDDFNSRFAKNQDIIGTLTCNIGSSTLRNGIKIIEVESPDICINDKGKVNKKTQITKGYSPTLVSEFHGNLSKVIELKGVAMRGRYNSDGKTEQKIEIRDDDLSNAITTVQKDCMILEVKGEKK